MMPTLPTLCITRKLECNLLLVKVVVEVIVVHRQRALRATLCTPPICAVIFTGRNEVVAKVMFLLEFVILFPEGVCLSACWETTPPLGGPDPPPLVCFMFYTEFRLRRVKKML